jgi:hypothetical protein
MIAKDFITAKDFYTYSINFLRQEKTLRDHRADDAPPRECSDWRASFG